MTNDNSLTELLSKVPESLHTIVENYWHDWCAVCEKSEFDSFPDLPYVLLGKTWACSDFVARNCIRYPAVFNSLNKEGFQLSRSFKNYQELVSGITNSVGDETTLMKQLRELRQQEMIRIAWRDLNSLADDETILGELSDFAEAIVSVTLLHLEKQQAEIYGMPQDSKGREQALLTFAMGKMGGRELNFSSDIDLIFAFAEDGETSGARKTSHYEFYLSVIRKLVKVLDEVTADGFVYRVDIRLRPFGKDGPLAMSFSGMEHYYQSQGRDWERYAMIKAKLITGREEDKKYLQSLLTPFVFRRYLDFSMIESIREMKAMINVQMKRKGMTDNIKLGRGGIREIEFIGQTLQLIRAGREPELRERSIIKVLTLLAEKKYLKKEEVEQLIPAYWFLRKLENRLQMRRDMQTHELPSDEAERQAICLAMGFSTWDELLKVLLQHQSSVDSVFQNLISIDGVTKDENLEDLPSGSLASGLKRDKVSPIVLFWDDLEGSEEVRQHLRDLNYQDVDELFKLLVQLRNSSQLKQLTAENHDRLSRLVSSLVSSAVNYDNAYDLLERVVRLVKALAGRKVYVSLLVEYPETQEKLLQLCAASEWFTARLINHPILLDSLLTIELNTDVVAEQQDDIRQLLEIELKQIEPQNTEPAKIDNYADDDNLEQQMDRMRQFKRKTVFSVAVSDVFYQQAVELVSDRLTDLANVLVEKILDISWRAMVAKYGQPVCVVEGETCYPTMSIVAYGKMGGNELGYGSDLDIIFLHNSGGDKQNTDGEKSLDNQHFFARVAQRVIHFLNTRTYSGVLYEADTRLRPNGQSGLMVSSVAAFELYQREKAWTWEHQALIRARFVTGNALIEQEFDRIRSSVLRQSVDARQLLKDVVVMREKMREHLTNKSVEFDIKQDAGGLVDIEFMTQAGILIHAEEDEQCIAHTATLELINELKQVGWYHVEEAEELSQAYRYFRKLKNWQNLQCIADSSDVPAHRDKVVATWNRLMPKAIGVSKSKM